VRDGEASGCYIGMLDEREKKRPQISGPEYSKNGSHWREKKPFSVPDGLGEKGSRQQGKEEGANGRKSL